MSVYKITGSSGRVRRSGLLPNGNEPDVGNLISIISITNDIRAVTKLERFSIIEAINSVVVTLHL